TLYVVQGHDHPWLLSNTLDAEDLSWVAGEPPAEGTRCGAKTRYRQADAACEVVRADADALTLSFSEAQWAVTPGQSAVLYDGEVCLGGGIIAATTPADAGSANPQAAVAAKHAILNTH
ncbi:MAG: tRNA 2-thiouridine(34) synthase MnmA, partial [Pandoraea sp.]|nr:tRNA 2-thiouridine(34) synthase MnmA [Pandoraea sp.]